MSNVCKEEKGFKLMRSIIDTLEIILAVILAAAILIASIKLLKLMYSDLVESELNKTKVLEILDMILLLLLAIDILRTLLTAVVRRRFPIRIVIEAAMLAVLREIISVEIRHLDWPMLVSLGIVFMLLSFMWIIIGRLEAEGKLREAMAT